MPAHPSSGQLVLLDIYLVQTSCGFGVHFYEYGGERDNMSKWLARRSDTDLEAYWQEKNQLSIDGKPTGILQDDA